MEDIVVNAVDDDTDYVASDVANDGDVVDHVIGAATVAFVNSDIVVDDYPIIWQLIERSRPQSVDHQPRLDSF